MVGRIAAWGGRAWVQSALACVVALNLACEDPPPCQGERSGVCAEDAEVDAERDVGRDVGRDGGRDAGQDMAPDLDLGADMLLDGPPDVASDVPPDIAPDLALDATPDGPPDAAPDVPPDADDDLVRCADNPEVCNTMDDDCDGVVDEGLDLGAECSRGVGECARSGFLSCGADNGVECFAEPGEPGSEVCNRLDDDCDGRVDEELEFPGIEPFVIEQPLETVTLAASGPRIGALARDPDGMVHYWGFTPAGGPPIHLVAPRTAISKPRLTPDIEIPEVFTTGWIGPQDEGDDVVITSSVVNSFQVVAQIDPISASEMNVVSAGRGLYGLAWTAPGPPATGPFFQFIDNEYRLLGQPSLVSQHEGVTRPSMVQADDEIGLVWTAGDPAHVYFRSLTELGPQGAVIQLSVDPVEPETAPRIATDGRRFLIAWHDAEGVQISALINQMPTAPLRLARGRWAVPAWDGIAFAVAWSDPDVRVTRLDATFEPIAAPVVVDQGDGPPELLGIRGDFIVGWIRPAGLHILRRSFCVRP